MKLKEIPPSLLLSLKLRNQNVVKIREINDSNRIPVVVSITSIPSRLQKIQLTIRSLLVQSAPPEKIVLWLNNDLKGFLPAALTRLKSPFFDIRYSPFETSHRKLIHCISDFPNSTIITADDDCMYHKSWSENLFRCHCKYPKDIISNMVRKINYTGNGKVGPYQSWGEVTLAETTHPTYVQVGYAGVLYPPHSLDSRAINPDLFLNLAPHADDLWFKAMAHLNGTQIRTSNTPGLKPKTIIGSQEFALNRANIQQDKNRIQWEALEKYFGLSIVK